MRFGALAKVGGVGVASVPAVHSNGFDPAYLHKDHGSALEANRLTACLGLPGATYCSSPTASLSTCPAIPASPRSRT